MCCTFFVKLVGGGKGREYQSHQRAVINTLFMYDICTEVRCIAVYITIMIQKPVKDENHFSLLRSIPQG